MLTDEVRISVSAGRGGDGVATFDKVKMSLGPTGGRGGHGGSVYFEGVADIFALNRYRHLKKHSAGDGKNGRANRSDGPNGQDLILPVPAGTIISNLITGKKEEIVSPGSRFLAARGGIGGRGNFSFRSSRNTSPRQLEKGKPGEIFDFFLELQLIADGGIIGLFSAGKSSLFNELTSARAKVGDYHFTTLEPNLGALERIILADILGLIEGASQGKGLGIKFLRHIRRTRVLIHCLSLESENLAKDYAIVRKELEKYDLELAKKPEIIVLTKSDLVSSGKILVQKKKLGEKGRKSLIISIHDWSSLEKFKKRLFSQLSLFN